MKSIRRQALEALMDITERGAYANLRLKQAQQGLSPRDAKWLSALVYETLDHLIYLDYMLAHFIKGKVQAPVRGILRMGACQMLFLRVPVMAACDESVKLTREIGKAALCGYVNGVLRALSRRLTDLPKLPQNTAERLCVQYSWPAWLVEEWLGRFGEEETKQLLAAKQTGMVLRVQPPYTVETLKQELNERGISFTQGALVPDCLKISGGFDIASYPSFLLGNITVQGEGAALACHACGVKGGMRVLDACAAPGGKAAYLYALAGGDIALTAWETHPHRKELLDKTLERLHVSAQTCVFDAAKHDAQYDEAFDVVLIDAPCSGLGVGKPDLRYAKSKQDIQALAALQGELMRACAAYVKRGGALVYATCTISEVENEDQVAAFLSECPDFVLEDLRPYIGELHGAKSGMVQLLPHRDKTEGFFIARMRRRG